jgi:pilus assembly protein Flp/PilA
MKKVIESIRNFLNDETGATAIEYGLLVGLIAAVIVAVVGFLGTEINAKFQQVCTALKGSACVAPPA